MMESAVGVEPVIVDGIGSSMNKENEIEDSVSDGLKANSTSQDPPEVEGLSASGVGEEKPVAVAGMKASNPSKSTKGMKDRVVPNGEAVISRNAKAALSKSISFPAKVAPTSNLRKSATFVKPKKTDAKNSSVTNGGLPAKQTSSATMSIARQSLIVKSGTLDATVSGTASESLQSNDGSKKLRRHTLSTKNDDDSHSTTSSTASRAMAQRKSIASGFSFKLDERAEKRKEFFMKLEEKISAKETEETNLQEKSKENREAEIKQLRKSLTFKATPMPNFYQEPGPPKIELKKIPTTRPRSPKLGRHKPSAAGENATGNNTSTKTYHPSPKAPNPSKQTGGGSNGKLESVASKKSTQRSLSKLPSQKSGASRLEAKPAGSKPKASNSKQSERAEKPEVVNSDKLLEDSPAHTVENSTSKNTNEDDANSFEFDASIPGIAPSGLLDTGIPSDEVLVLENSPDEVLVDG